MNEEINKYGKMLERCILSEERDKMHLERAVSFRQDFKFECRFDYS